VLPDIIENIINTIGTLIPLIIDAGIELLVALVDNLPAIINGIVAAIPKIMNSIINALVNNIPLIIETGVKLLTALITNLPQIITELVKAMPIIITEMVKALGKGVVEFAKIGLELIKGLWNGIKDAGAWLMDKIKGFIGGVTDGIKEFFGIKSPSKLMADEVGKWLPEGLAVGIEANIKPVSQAMEELASLTTGTLESQIRVNPVGSINLGPNKNNGITQYLTINSPIPLTPSETARQIKNASRQLAMGW
ncbi:MAG: phage tail protein, partial [Clostridiales bacterium]|nr:phage tail protein [Clostridiales bacterium]